MARGYARFSTQDQHPVFQEALHAWPFPIGRCRDCWPLSGFLGGQSVIITSADPYQPLEVVVRSSQAVDDWEAGL